MATAAAEAQQRAGKYFMEGFQFIDIIILAMVAGFIILRLRSVLGRRTGHEPKRESGGRSADAFPRAAENVVQLPPTQNRNARDVSLDIEPIYLGTPLEPGLVKLKIADHAFSATRFLEGAGKAFEMIVEAYAKHDTDTLKPLLSADVYSRFAAAIQDREDRGETMETELVVLKPPKLETVEMKGTRAVVAVRFQSEQVNIMRDRDGKVIEGDRNQVESVTDIWTFERDTAGRDPNWILIATHSDD